MDKPGYDSWIQLLRRIKSDGYDGIECSFNGLPADGSKDAEFQRAVRESGLRLIIQIHTCTYTGRPEATKKDAGVYDQGYVNSANVDDHVRSLEKFLTRAKAIGPELVNVHGGHDSWDVETVSGYLGRAVALEKAFEIPMVHETHRRRIFWNPFMLEEVLRRVPDAKINADLSHWCCACERVFSEETDETWPGILGTVAKHCRLIHARVGHSQGAQVTHPAAPEFQFEVEEHLKWWHTILNAAEERGDTEFRVEPEFGAPGYQRLEPFTCKPVEDLWEINNYVAGRLANEFRQAKPSRAAFKVPPPLLRAFELGELRRTATAVIPAQVTAVKPTKDNSFIAGLAVGAATAALIAFLIVKTQKPKN